MAQLITLGARRASHHLSWRSYQQLRRPEDGTWCELPRSWGCRRLSWMKTKAHRAHRRDVHTRLWLIASGRRDPDERFDETPRVTGWHTF